MMKQPQSTIHRLCALVLLCLLQACSSNTTLFSGLNQEEANEIYATLLQVGIPAERSTSKTGVSVAVPDNLSAEALKVLQSKGLPRDQKSSMGEVFKKDSMISSPLEERARYLYALSQELERTIMRMDGVIASRVHMVLPERSTPGEPLSPSSAAVFIKYDPSTSFPAYVPKVRELVFNSIPGLTGDAHTTVSVVAVPAENLQNNCVELLWYGPIAIHPDNRWAVLAMAYAMLALWAASLGVVWLQAKDAAEWPAPLKKLRERFRKNG
ncbi:MAG TPA: type III secretion inner membrane ring lipoprotein SctJ [Limnobacter sp.]|nr:type III secretion inner membrane ring lipoprotein SctJ [Limnobacter sp.]